MLQSASRQPDSLPNRLFSDIAAPFFRDRFPGHAGGNLFQHLRDQEARPAKRRLPVADVRVENNITAHQFLVYHAGIVPIGLLYSITLASVASLAQQFHISCRVAAAA